MYIYNNIYIYLYNITKHKKLCQLYNWVGSLLLANSVLYMLVYTCSYMCMCFYTCLHIHVHAIYH